MIEHLSSKGQSILTPVLRDIKLSVSTTPTITLRGLPRNAPSFYRRLGEPSIWECTCDRHPHLPRVPSPDGSFHIFAPQDCWAWPLKLAHLRTLPAHTSLVPGKSRLSIAWQRIVQRIAAKLSYKCPDGFACQLGSEMADRLSASSKGSRLDFKPVNEDDVKVARRLVNGLIVEEIQKTKHVLVAECPRRVHLLCRKLFGMDDDASDFTYYPGLTSPTILEKVASIPHLSPHLALDRLSNPKTWSMSRRSAPNKSRHKPDSRRPLIGFVGLRSSSSPQRRVSWTR